MNTIPAMRHHTEVGPPVRPWAAVLGGETMRVYLRTIPAAWLLVLIVALVTAEATGAHGRADAPHGCQVQACLEVTQR